MKALNIYVDETGEFGFGKGSSLLYGVSFVLIGSKYDISGQIIKLNKTLERLKYDKMIHTTDLVMNRKEYALVSYEERKSIFNALFFFTKSIPIKTHSIIIEKKYKTDKIKLHNDLYYHINKFINDNCEYFKSFDAINLYYDNGQEPVKIALDDAFNIFDNYNHISDFDHKKEVLFQVADMMTFIDKYYYKYNHKLPLNVSEKYFISFKERRDLFKLSNNKKIAIKKVTK